jgi:hypothetical protein
MGAGQFKVVAEEVGQCGAGLHLRSDPLPVDSQLELKIGHWWFTLRRR